MVGSFSPIAIAPALFAAVQASSCQQSCDLFPQVPGVLHTDKCYCWPGSLCGNNGSQPELHDCPKDFDFSQLYAGAEFYTYTKDPKHGYFGYDECGYDGPSMTHDKEVSLCQDRDKFNSTCTGIGIDASCFVGFNSKYGGNFNFFQSIALAQPHMQSNTLHFWAVIDDQEFHYGDTRASWGNTSAEAIVGLALPNPGHPRASRVKASQTGIGGCPDQPCGSSAVVI